jgi:hypothetical protein
MRRFFTEPGRWRRKQWVAMGLLSLAPIVPLLAWLILFHTGVPFGDQWELVPLMQKHAEGTLTTADLWAPHNGHRLVVPRVVLLALAHATGWQVEWELALSFLLATGFCAVFLAHAWLTFRRMGCTAWGWCLPVCVALIFSLSQWQNWFMGWQMQIFLCLLAAWGAFVALTLPGGRWPDFLLAMACAIIASFSFGSGLMTWAAGALVCMMLPHRDRLARCMLWIAFGVLVHVVYFSGLGIDAHGESSASPALLPIYVLKYLGAPLAHGFGGEQAWLDGMPALVLGGVGIMVWAAAVRSLALHREKAAAWWMPYAALGLFAILCAMATAPARIGDAHGTQQALSSRYITLANGLWLSNAMLAALAWGQYARDGHAWKAWAIAAVAYLLIGLAALQGAYTWTLRYPAYHAAREELLRGGEAGAHLHYLYPPDTRELLDRAEWLRAHGLGIFRAGARK